MKKDPTKKVKKRSTKKNRGKRWGEGGLAKKETRNAMQLGRLHKERKRKEARKDECGQQQLNGADPAWRKRGNVQVEGKRLKLFVTLASQTFAN